MANYTTQVRSICEQKYGSLVPLDGSKVNEIIDAVANEIMGDYPIFDEQYRSVLNRKILKHYYTREIGEETYGLWKFRLNTRMNEIMPYYNKLYESELISFNPLYDVELHTSKSGAGEKNETRNGESEREKVSGVVGSETQSSSGSETSSKNGEEEYNKSGTSGREKTNSVTESNSGAESTEREVSGVENGTRETKQNGKEENSEQGTDSKVSDRNGENDSSTSNKNVSSATEQGSKNQLDKYADTPQGSVSNLLNGTYLTNARDISGDESKIIGSTENGENNVEGSFKESGSEIGNSSRSGKSETESTGKEVSGSSTNSNLSESKNNSGERSEEGSEKESKVEAETGGKNVNESTSISKEGSVVNEKKESGNEVGSERSKENNFVSSTESYLESVSGKRGTTSYSKMILEYRETFINIDLQVINALSDLFIGLWE